MTNFETEIRRSGYIVYTNKGDSMMPLLRQDRDLLVIRAVTAPLKKNDVVLFKRENGAYVLHRIIKVCGMGMYRICGDNRDYAEPVPEEWIIGILTEIIRDGQHITMQDPSYLQYMKKLPARRFRLKLRHYFKKIKSIVTGGKE